MKIKLVPPMKGLGGFKHKITKEINTANKNSKVLMDKTTTKFQNVTVDFIIKKANEIGGGLIGFTAPKDTKGGKIWFFLNDGTKIRYAVMTPDFKPKTTPHTLTTVSGRGGLSHFDFDNPRPGIEARMWTEIIAKLEGKKFETRIIKTMKDFVKGLF